MASAGVTELKTWSRVTWLTVTECDSSINRLPRLPGNDQQFPGIGGCCPWEEEEDARLKKKKSFRQKYYLEFWENTHLNDGRWTNFWEKLKPKDLYSLNPLIGVRGPFFVYFGPCQKEQGAQQQSKNADRWITGNKDQSDISYHEIPEQS